MFSGLTSYMNNLVQGSEMSQIQKELEAQRKGSGQISYEIADLNFDTLRRKRAFYKGVNIQLAEEMDKGELIGFGNLPDILPIKPKGAWDGLNYDELVATTLTEEEQKEASAEGTPGQSANLFNYDTQDSASKQALLDRFDLISKRQINFKFPDGLPVAIIFNPFCTGNRNEEIQQLFFDKDIANEMIVCNQNLDPFQKVLELDLEKYSALICVGGDGTLNQMVNGMLARPDKKRLPVGLIPTGQSNDMARSLGIASDNIMENIAYIKKGQAIAIDTTRVLLDHDSESTVPDGAERLNYCRHMLSNASLAMPAKISTGANSWYSFNSFSISTYLQAFSCGFVQETYQLTIDDQPFNSGISTALMMVNNGKYSQGGMIMNPFAALNDGLIDITWIEDPAYQGTFGVTGVLSDASGNEGIQAYKGHSKYVRGRKIRIDLPQPQATEGTTELEITPDQPQENGAAAETPQEPSTPAGIQKESQVIIIDGDALEYSTSILWECFPGNIEVLIDDTLFKQNGTFSRQMNAQTEKDRVYAQVVDKLWVKFDKDNSGALDRAETKIFLQTVLADCPAPNDFREDMFDQTFEAMDKNQDNLIQKNEMIFFVKSLLAGQ